MESTAYRVQRPGARSAAMDDVADDVADIGRNARNAGGRDGRLAMA